MDARELHRCERLLLVKLDELSATKAEAVAPGMGSGGWPGDPINRAAVQTEAELQVRVHQADARLLRAIDEVLTRIRCGTLGVCELCEQPITKARLGAVP